MARPIPEALQRQILAAIQARRLAGEVVRIRSLGREFGVSHGVIERLVWHGEILSGADGMGDPTPVKCRRCPHPDSCVECQARAALAVGGITRTSDSQDDELPPSGGERPFIIP
jgi:hypothetical protein